MFEGTKEHESILVTGAQPQKIYEALGLIGATTGSPVSFDPATNKRTAASGSPLSIEVAYDANGQAVRHSAHKWMIDSKTKAHPCSTGSSADRGWKTGNSQPTPTRPSRASSIFRPR
ncbi:MAG: YdjY domain-containing protein [Phycisphaerae bacterium]